MGEDHIMSEEIKNEDKNFTENRLGGIDCERFIKGEYMPYTMTAEEAQAVDPEVVAPLSDEVKAQALKAQSIAQLKATRNASLGSNVYTFADGRVIQTRPGDAANIQGLIQGGQPSRFTMLDDSVELLTVAELQEAYVAGVISVKAIWDEYHDAVETLNV